MIDDPCFLRESSDMADDHLSEALDLVEVRSARTSDAPEAGHTSVDKNDRGA